MCKGTFLKFSHGVSGATIAPENCALAIKSTTGVQQGDPLGPLLLSLVVLDVLDSIGQTPGLTLQLWYLDDGTFVGSCTAVSSLLNKLYRWLAPHTVYVLLNMNKCDVFWPTGDTSFPEFPGEIQRIQNFVGWQWERD